MLCALGINDTVTAAEQRKQALKQHKLEQANIISPYQQNNHRPSLKQSTHSIKEPLINDASLHYTNYGLHNVLLNRASTITQQ